jgi:hypothetical protein
VRRIAQMALECGGMALSALLAGFPPTLQNPLYPLDKFTEYCEKRFRSMSTATLAERLRNAAVVGTLRPVVVSEDHLFYSAFQLWQVRHLTWCEAVGVESARIGGYEPILKLLIAIQDYYLPEVRGNRRFGRWLDYGGMVAFGGSWFCESSTYVISYVRFLRKQAIAEGKLDPAAVMTQSGVDAETLRRWKDDLLFDAATTDPIAAWRDLVASIDYDERLKLQFDALIAHDLYEIVEMLRLFSVDANLAPPAPEFSDPTDVSFRDKATGLPTWKLKKYGETMWRPFEQLEYITNDYGINPRPRGIILTEGGEAEAIGDLFRYKGFDPELLGIELRPIHGAGSFKLANWQVFIEYMHEKQVLVFFIVDAEGDTPAQARRMLAQKRLFPCKGLQKVIPAEDRIVVWETSFEEANFEDAEISAAMTGLGVHVSHLEVAAARQSREAKGLIKYLLGNKRATISKPLLCTVLVKDLIARRALEPGMPLRPIERFVEAAGNLILLNHQPTSIELVKTNRESGFLG